MKTLMQQALEDLEAKGLIVRNGKMRRNRPVYVLAPKYGNDLEAAKRVLGKRPARDKKPKWGGWAPPPSSARLESGTVIAWLGPAASAATPSGTISKPI